jgi:hypothetical protein
MQAFCDLLFKFFDVGVRLIPYSPLPQKHNSQKSEDFGALYLSSVAMLAVSRIIEIRCYLKQIFL